MNINSIGGANGASFTATRKAAKPAFEPIILAGTPNANMVEIHAATLGADFDYSKEDAIDRAWSKQNTIKLDEASSEAVKKYFDAAAKAEFAASLNRDSFLTEQPDFFHAETDFSAISADNLKQGVDYISSRIAVMMEQIHENCSGDERAAMLEKLDALANSTYERIAKDFADVVGGFFEQNGVEGERDRIYESVLSEFQTTTKGFSEYLKGNKGYAGIDGTPDAWLKNDSAYMASALRAATTSISVPNDTGYSIDELVKMRDFANEINSYDPNQFINNTGNAINKFASEEEIGVRLAEVVLKAEMFNQISGVSDQVKDAVTKSTDKFVENTIQSIQDFLNYQIKMKEENYIPIPDQVLRGLSPLNKDSIYAVIDATKDVYSKTGDFGKALSEGTAYAKTEFSRKLQNGSVSGLFRYEQISYLSNAVNASNRYSAKGLKYEDIADSWNRFAKRVSSNVNVQVRKEMLSMLI